MRDSWGGRRDGVVAVDEARSVGAKLLANRELDLQGSLCTDHASMSSRQEHLYNTNHAISIII
jgi:hypothetical protein